ncbi:Rrf2 family transcriptional regulator, partial [Candidatus Dependentiae bacterium]|nr:Rrf2 family transcriptional regulator [Candidatus Dependentiae bacterium]
ISDIQGISTTYLEHLLVKLKKANIVGSQRGAKGGFFLEKKPKDITLCDVILAVEGPVFLSKCLNSNNTTIDCKFINDCEFQGFWSKLSKSIENLFSKITLKEILGEINE